MADKPSNESTIQPSTAHMIEVARRPLIVSRTTENERALDQIGDPLLAQLDEIPEACTEILSAIGEDLSLRKAELGEGLMEQACLAYEAGDITEDDLVPILGGCYRRAQDLLKAYQNNRPCALIELKTLRCGDLMLIKSPPASAAGDFGVGTFRDSVVYTLSQGENCRSSLRLISRAADADSLWQEASGEPSLSRKEEEPLEALPKEERKSARAKLLQRRIRNSFFKKVFLLYFDRDTLDPAEIAAHPTILDWLNAIADTPHLFPFMQGQTQSQKLFRLRELWRKVLQLNELYQRVDQARQDPDYHDTLADRCTQECMQILTKQRYPALKVDTDFSIATALSPLKALLVGFKTR